jgi:hypothetical protein
MRRNASRDGSGWRIECSQLSLKRKSPRLIETACYAAKGFLERMSIFGVGKPSLNTRSAIS